MSFNLKKVFGKDSSSEEEYLPLEFDHAKDAKSRVVVRPFTLKQFDDVTEILNSLREGYTIAVIDIKPLRSKDMIELKRSIAKIKKTIDAMQGSIAGFGENLIIVTPDFAEVYKGPEKATKKDQLSFY